VNNVLPTLNIAYTAAAAADVTVLAVANAVLAVAVCLSSAADAAVTAVCFCC